MSGLPRKGSGNEVNELTFLITCVACFQSWKQILFITVKGFQDQATQEWTHAQRAYEIQTNSEKEFTYGVICKTIIAHG